MLWELPAAVPAVVEADPEIAADVEAEPGVVADEEVAASPDELHPATAATEAARSNAIITTRAGFKPRPSFIPCPSLLAKVLLGGGRRQGGIVSRRV